MTRKGTRRSYAAGAVALGALGTGVLAAACGAGASGGQPSAATRKPVTLQYWSRFGGVQEELENKQLPVFMEKLAPYKVERTLASTVYAELIQKITVAMASGTPPDVFTVGSPDVATFADPGSAYQLDSHPRIKKESEDFFAGPLNVGKYKDKLFGLTYFVDVRILLARKDLLKEAGMPQDVKSQPATWTQFMDWSKKLTRTERAQVSRAGFEVPKPMATTNGEFFLTMLAQLGKGFFNPEGTRVGFDGPEGQRALQLIVDMVNRDRIDTYDRPNPPQNVPAIASQVVASQWTNSSAISTAQRAGLDPAQNLVAYPTPDFTTTRKVTAYMGGTWQMIAKATKDTDAAAELVLFLCGPDMALQQAQATTTVPARKSLDKAPYLQDPLLRTYYEAQANGWAVAQHPKYGPTRVHLIAALQAAMRQEKSVKAALEEAASQVNAELAKK
jgi:ABC-type glycerol-3-phosphate transport system substrate-binding protein